MHFIDVKTELNTRLAIKLYSLLSTHFYETPKRSALLIIALPDPKLLLLLTNSIITLNHFIYFSE